MVAVCRIDDTEIIAKFFFGGFINALRLCPQFRGLKEVLQHLLPFRGVKWLLEYLAEIVFGVGQCGISFIYWSSLSCINPILRHCFGRGSLACNSAKAIVILSSCIRVLSLMSF